MSHRKFEAPRHGHLGFLPRKRCKRGRGRVKSFPKDNQKQQPHLIAFIGYKAGMTHIVRDFVKAGQKVTTIEVIDPVTVIETPPMKIVGITGYVKTPWGLKNLTAVYSRKLSNQFKRRVATQWRSKNKNAFRNHQVLFNTEEYKQDRTAKIEALKGADVIRVIAVFDGPSL
jgi:large subunit ribosomal protein L3e